MGNEAFIPGMVCGRLNQCVLELICTTRTTCVTYRPIIFSQSDNIRFFSKYNGPKPDWTLQTFHCRLCRRHFIQQIQYFAQLSPSCFKIHIRTFIKHFWLFLTSNFQAMAVKGLSTSVHENLNSDFHISSLYLSSHPQLVKNFIPFSQFLRIRRLWNNDSDFRDNSKPRKCASTSKDMATPTLPSIQIDIDRETALHKCPKE